MKHPLTLILAILAAQLTFCWYGLAHGAGSTYAALARVPVHQTDSDEAPEAHGARLEEIAQAIDAATPNLDERAWLIMTAQHESGLARRVTEDHDYCRLGRGGACDSGRAFGLFQLHGVSRDLSKAEQAVEALTRFRRAARYCHARGFDWWAGGTSQYGTGRSAEQGGCSWAGAEGRVRAMRRIRGRL